MLPGLGRFDAAVTDPPYGISIGGSGRIGGSGVVEPTQYRPVDWDGEGMTKPQWEAIRKASDWQVVFGFNHLAAVLGPCSGVIVWDKKCRNDWWDNFSDCELAWTNKDGPARAFRHLWMGALRDSDKGEQERVHPTQKPVALMRWVIEHWTEPGWTVIDPFCGSGTTGVACRQLGRNFIGIEQDAAYAEIARRRIASALNPQTYRSDEPGDAPLFGTTPPGVTGGTEGG